MLLNVRTVGTRMGTAKVRTAPLYGGAEVRVFKINLKTLSNDAYRRKGSNHYINKTTFSIH
jgi:hypothetical protein